MQSCQIQLHSKFYYFTSLGHTRIQGILPTLESEVFQRQIRELREVIELPLLNPELFQRVGITPPKGCLLYGPPGTGKTLLARAVASQLDANFLKVVSSAIVDKYIGNKL